ncbi:MAG: hypothetical protein R3F59_07225 [Myxococcota bacterium]
MTLIDVLATAVVVALCWAMLSVSLRSLPRQEGQIVAASFAMHTLASFATAIIAQVVYRGVVDFAGFEMAGKLIADAVRQDPIGVLPRAVALFLHQDTFINVPLNFDARGGRSTLSMWALAAFGDLLFLGSFQATATACALFSFSGKLVAFRALRGYFPAPVRPYVAGAALLVPSVVYWTSGLIKEGIAVGGIGYALWGAHTFWTRRRPLALLVAAFGVVIVVVIKPYLLMPLGVGFGALIYVRGATAGGRTLQIRPLYLLAGAAVAVSAIVLIGRLFPLFALENLGEAAAKMQFYGRKAAGGSFYLLGDPSERSLLGQLQFAPMALFTALYRPTLLDVNNPLLLLNSFETTALLGLTVWLLFNRGWRWAVGQVLTNPALAFCAAFALPLALGVGLVSNNLGTLSRYRCPMVPYQTILLVVLTVGATAAARARAPVSARTRPPPSQRPPRRRPAPAPEPGGT